MYIGYEGNRWYEGVGSPSGALGVDGDLFLDGVSGDVYEKITRAWVLHVS